MTAQLRDRLVLDLPVNPVPLKRPRTTFARSVGVRTYTPDPEGFAEKVRVLARLGGARRPLEGDLAVTLRFWRHCHQPSARGDLDNLVKAVLDAGNGFIWRDDRQVTAITASIEAAGPDITGRIVLVARTRTETLDVDLGPERAHDLVLWAGMKLRAGEMTHDQFRMLTHVLDEWIGAR